jgi:hypothetical protein
MKKVLVLFKREFFRGLKLTTYVIGEKIYPDYSASLSSMSALVLRRVRAETFRVNLKKFLK